MGMSLRDLIESRAAQRCIALRTLWSWVLDAIAGGADSYFSRGMSLDTPFDHGGMWLTWRDVIKNAARSIERHIPSKDSWANQLSCDPGRFDKWLEDDSPARTVPALSGLPKRSSVLRIPMCGARSEEYCEIENKQNSSTSIPRMWKYLKSKNPPGATRDQGIKALHAIEDGPKGPRAPSNIGAAPQ